MDDLRDTFRSSTIGWLFGTLAGLGTVLLAIAGPVATIATAGEWGAWPLAASALAIVIVIVKWVQNLTATYQVTEERLIIRRGIFFKSIDEIELYRIKDVRMDFTLLGQMVGIGSICVISSDETTRVGNLVMRDVPGAHKRREALRRLVDTARQRRGVREIDMAHDDF